MRDIDVLIIGTVNTCNSRCRICPLYTNYPEESRSMSDELYKKLIDDATQQRIGTVGFGLFNEPLMDKKIVDRVKYCREKMPQTTINLSTNGQLLTPDKIEQLKPYVSLFLISFHALDPEIYHYLCPNLNQEKVIENMDALLGGTTGVHIASIVTKKNIEEIDKIKTRFPKAKVEAYRLSNRCDTLPIFTELSLSFEKGCCRARAVKDLIVDWDGSVLLCCQDFNKNLILGNVKTQTIEEIMGSPLRADIKDLLEQERYNEIPTCRICVWENIDSVAKAAQFKNFSYEVK